MTHLGIEAKFTNGQGSIVLRPRLDPESSEMIHNLGIAGISCFFDGEDAQGENEGFVFNHTERATLENTAQSIADAVSKTGCIVTFVQEASVNKTVRPKHLAGRILDKVKLR